MKHRSRLVPALSAVIALAGCGEDGGSTGAIQVRIEAEETITEGLAPGGGDEAIVDGWTVAFDRYVIAIGEVHVEGGGPGDFHRDEVIAVDLARLPEGGLEVARFEGMAAGLWPEVFYATPALTAGASRHETVSQADFDRMVEGGCTYLITGTITSPSGQRCPRGDGAACESATEIAFDLCVPAPTDFGPCESDTGIEGVTVAAGTTTTVSLTIHGDHLFFNGFPVGAESVVERRAQWLANADIDADGTVTREDLESIGASDLGQLLPGYELGGAPIPLDDAWDYVIAQLKTQGHFQGEGTCPWDGHAHAH